MIKLTLFAYPFRIFFLSLAIWAIAVVALWIASVTGLTPLEFALPALRWHQHEMLFAILNPAIGIPLFYVLHAAPFMLGIALMVLILAFAIFHPVLKTLRGADASMVDEDEEEIGLH